MKKTANFSLFLRSQVALWIISVAPFVWADSPLRFGEPLQVSPAAMRAMGPDIAVDPAGAVHVLWIDKAPKPAAAVANPADHSASDDVYHRELAKGSMTLGPPTRVNNVQGEVWGATLSKPQIDVGRDGVVHVMYPANAVQSGTGKGVLATRYSRSLNGGKSFEPARTLNSAATNDLSGVMHGGFAAAHAFGTLTAAGQHEVHVYWIDSRYMDKEDTAGALFEAVSRDSGATFESDEVVFKDEVCPCCQLAASAPADTIFLSSRRTFPGGYRDPTVAVSEGIDTFSEQVRVGEGHWQIEGCPLKRTAIAAHERDVYAAWFTAGQEPVGVYFAHSADAGKSYGPSVAVHPGAAVSDAPAVATDDQGVLFLAWHAKTGSNANRRLFMSTSRDGGATLSAPTEVPTPPGAAEYPELAAVPGGGAYLTWQQADAAFMLRVEAAPVQVAKAE